MTLEHRRSFRDASLFLETDPDETANLRRNCDQAVVRVERIRPVDDEAVVRVADADLNVGWNAVAGCRPSYVLDAADSPTCIDVLDGPFDERPPSVDVRLGVPQEQRAVDR